MNLVDELGCLPSHVFKPLGMDSCVLFTKISYVNGKMKYRGCFHPSEGMDFQHI